MVEMKEAHGKDVLEGLAEIYQQLYVCPGADGGEKYAEIVNRGQEAEEKSLSHFKTNEKDRLEYVDTPAGKVCVITLYERQDFVTFLQIMTKRCAAAPIPDTQGASTLSGVINWRRIEAHEEEFMKAEREKGNPDPDWNEEFKRFTSDKKNYLDTMIVLSVGPYSGIPGSSFGFSEEEWLGYSNSIRLYHECTHFICRKKYPEKKDAIWDELVADAVGICAAFGKYDRSMEERFLGISDGSYIGGRLENYIKVPDGNDPAEEKRRQLDELVSRIEPVLEGFEGITAQNSGARPFEIAELLEGSMESLWTNAG